MSMLISENNQKQFYEIVCLIKAKQNRAVMAVNFEMIDLYWNVGRYISIKIANATWGDKTVEELSAFIQRNYPEIKGFNRMGLYRMRKFYETYSSCSFVSSAMTQIQNTDNQIDEIVSTVLIQFDYNDIRNTVLARINWSHHLTIISKAKTDEERQFYINLCIAERYSVRELERQIDSSLFERVMLGSASIPKRLKETYPDIVRVLRDNYVIEFSRLTEAHDEDQLQKSLIARMKKFILELGKDFLFCGEKYRIQVGNKDFYIDLLFFHRGLQCLIAFELKAQSFHPENLGQLNFYLEALDRDVKKPHENPSIGVLLCKDKDDAVVEYAMSRYLSPAMVSEYQIQLPDKKLLQQKLKELYND